MRGIVGLAVALTLVAPRARAAENSEEREPRGLADVEMVVGAGQVEALQPVLAGNLSGQLRYERALTDVAAVGFVVSGRYDVTRGFSLGARVPIAVAVLAPDGDTSRGDANLGNVELEAEGEVELSKKATLFAGLGLALPTSSGSELPSEDELAGDQAGVDAVSADRFAVNEAVSSAYGDEQSALWLAGYFGVVPAVGARFQIDRVRIEPYAKLESLVSVRPEADERAIVELVAGGRVAVRIVKGFDLGVRAWGTFTLTNHEGDGNTAVIEPEARVGGERWRVTAGVLVPVAGELFDRGWVAGRLSGTVAF